MHTYMTIALLNFQVMEACISLSVVLCGVAGGVCVRAWVLQCKLQLMAQNSSGTIL